MKKKTEQKDSFVEFMFESKIFIAGNKMPRTQYTKSEINRWSLPRLILIPISGLFGFIFYSEWGAIIGVTLFVLFSYTQFLILKRKFDKS